MGSPPLDPRFTLHGDSPAIRSLLRTIDRVAESDAPVLIVGETGTGKELVARAIHQRSRRAAGALVAVNCGAIAPTLIQSELFGHERYAYTGAGQRRIGSFEAAHGGALFLDEIGELPLALQPALLRVLQDRLVTRLGASTPVPVDFRLLAATHVNLEQAIIDGRFREDLYYRINVLVLQVPPLRDRGDDLLVLAESFLSRFGADRQGPPIRGFTPDAILAMQRHRWPGNVRELMNCVQRAVVLTEGVWIDAAALGLQRSQAAQRPLNLAQAREAFERELVRDTLRLHGRRIAPAARQLGVSRVTLYRIVARLKLAGDLPPEEAARLLEAGEQSGLLDASAADLSSAPTAGATGVSDPNHDRIGR
jgi:DNA-binding NtrC family response regulator